MKQLQLDHGLAFVCFGDGKPAAAPFWFRWHFKGLLYEPHGFSTWVSFGSFSSGDLALVLIQLYVCIMHTGVVGGATTFCAEPLTGSGIPADVQVFHRRSANPRPGRRDQSKYEAPQRTER